MQQLKISMHFSTSYYQRKLKLFEGDIKKTWKITKEVIGKKRSTCDSFSSISKANTKLQENPSTEARIFGNIKAIENK